MAPLDRVTGGEGGAWEADQKSCPACGSIRARGVRLTDGGTPMKPMVLRPMDGRALSATTREACAAESVPRTPQLKSRGPCLAANPRHLTSTGGVTALGVQTRRAKHGARATEPTPLPTPSTPPIDRRRSHDDRSAAGTPVAVAARRCVDVRSRRDAGAGPAAGEVQGLRARAVARRPLDAGRGTGRDARQRCRGDGADARL